MKNLSQRVFSFAVVVIFGVVGTAAGQGSSEKKGADPQLFWDCSKACDDCGRVCTACGAHCANLIADGHKEHAETMRTCQDCASICKAAGAVTARVGPYSDVICTACAEACKRCGEACSKHAAHDAIMKKCQEECVACEKACREMLKHTGHGTK